VSRAEEDDAILPPEAEAALLEALAAALRPQPLNPATLERLVQMALEDPLAPPSSEELAESARLRDALADGTAHDADPLVGALRASFAAPRDDAASVERALERALRPEAAEPARGRVIYAWFGGAGVALAAAAAIALFVSPLHKAEPAPSAAASAPELARPRSTAELFADRFETSATSERMDLIASARARDLRDNRYAAWGVR
jgi:hypothetical protein